MTSRQLVRYAMVFRVALSSRHSTTVSLEIKRFVLSKIVTDDFILNCISGPSCWKYGKRLPPAKAQSAVVLEYCFY